MSYLEEYRDEIYGCTTLRCGGCGTSCPGFAGGFESNTPRGRMRIARGVLEGELELTDALVERVFLCNMCGHCKMRCAFSPVDVVYALKAEIVKAGKAPPEVYAMLESIKDHNMCFKPHEDRLNCLPEELREPREAEVLFFLSCHAAYHRPESVHSTAKILDAAGVRWTTLGLEERCCGVSMIQYGLPEKGEELLTHNVRAINEAAATLGVTTMIASCPGCATMFKDWPRKYGLSLDVEVLHTTELFHRLIEAGKLRFKEWDTTCTYHDACWLGRMQGVYEEPRESLKAIPGLRLVDSEPNRDMSPCCGSIPWWTGRTASLGLKVDPRHVRHAHINTRKKLQQIRETGADSLVVACTGCLILERMMTARHGKVDVKLISDALAERLITEE